jgi:peroxiredoxin
MKLIIFLGCVLFNLIPVLNPSGYVPGDVAADFKLKNINGKFISLSDYKNVKGFIVIFTCNHCPYAVMYEDRIMKLHAEFGNEYPIIAINPNDPTVEPEDSVEGMKERAKEKGYNFEYLMDEKQEVFPKFGATKTPHVYLLDKNRVVKYVGAIDDNPQDESLVKNKFLENAINALKSGKTINPSTTKALGCSIKVSKSKK